MTQQTTTQTAAQSLEYARHAMDVASDKLASDIVILDIAEVSDFADYFVILTVESTRQMRAVVEDLEHALEDKGAARHHREGTPESGWMLLDFGDVVIHVCSARTSGSSTTSNRHGRRRPNWSGFYNPVVYTPLVVDNLAFVEEEREFRFRGFGRVRAVY